MAETKEVIQPWTYAHVNGGEHPDNKGDVTKVAVASDEAVQKETDAMNALYAKEHANEPPGIEQQKSEPKAEQEENLDDHTVPELKDIAAKKGIAIPWDANKGDIIKAIKKGK